MGSLLLIGFLLGMRHALEADHLAAVATLSQQSNDLRDALRQGAYWGLGHSLTLFLFGSIALLVDNVIPANLAAGLEFAVGIMLILLGVDVLWRVYKNNVHFHIHQHNQNNAHFHAHSHAGETSHTQSSHQHQHTKGIPRRALMIGLMHGMAGSAALIILTFERVQNLWQGLLYMTLFGMGSIAGMAVLSAIIAVPLRRSAMGMTWLYNGLQLSVAAFTISIGSLIVIAYLSPSPA